MGWSWWTVLGLDVLEIRQRRVELSSSGIFLGSENVLYARGNWVTHNILEFLKENWVEAIGSRSFEWFKGEDSFFNFQVGDILKEKVMNVSRNVIEV